MASLTPRLVSGLVAPPFIPVFGVDVSVQATDTYEVYPSAPGWGESDRGTFGIGDQDAFATSDVISISTTTGMLMSFSLKGGATVVDSSRNAECYGEGVSAGDLLSATSGVPPPPQMQPLYDKLAAILKIEPKGPNHD